MLVVSVLVGVKRYAFGGGVMRIHVESMDTIERIVGRMRVSARVSTSVSLRVWAKISHQENGKGGIGG